MTTRLLIFALAVLLFGAGFSWLADRPGDISMVWQGQRLDMSLMEATTLVVALVAAILLTWWLVRAVWQSPRALTRHFRARKRDRGYQALSTGLIAAGAGDASLARKMSARAQGLLKADQEPLLHLLDAQTALIEGRHDDARRKFERMADDPETRELGLRGLYLEAKRLGAGDAARQYAERAAQTSPHLSWAAQAAMEHRCQTGQWDEAIRLLDQSRAANAIDRKEADRKKAVLLTAKASEKLETDPHGAQENALAALKLADNFVPAGLIAAQALFRDDNLRKGASILEKIWKVDPHPEIARIYVKARSGDSALDRLKRAEKLESLKPNNADAMAAVAKAALDAREFTLARSKAEAAARMVPSESNFLLLADIEEAETGDQGRIRHWMNQALRAPRDAVWTADGVTSPVWLPVSPVTGALDAFEWKVPVGQIAGPVEEGELHKAFDTLPPPTAEPRPAEPAPQTILRSEPAVVQPAKPAEPAPAQSQPIGQGGPFFGHPPDDPGVKKSLAETQPLRLY